MIEEIVLSIVTKTIKIGPLRLKPYMAKVDFDAVVMVLKSVSNYFSEGSWIDINTEKITADLANYFRVKLNDHRNPSTYEVDRLISENNVR